VDCHLSWDCHVQFISNKIASGLHVLKRMSFLCNLETLKSLYFAHVHSHLSYGLAIYGGTSKQNLNKILKLQKKAIRIIFKLDINESVKQHFSKLGILTIYDQYILECIICVKNQFHKQNFHRNIHSHFTRNRDAINLSQHKLKFFTKKAMHMGSTFFIIYLQILKLALTKHAFEILKKVFIA